MKNEFGNSNQRLDWKFTSVGKTSPVPILHSKSVSVT